MTVEESIRAAIAAELIPLHAEIARLVAQVEAMRNAIPPTRSVRVDLAGLRAPTDTEVALLAHRARHTI